MPFLIILRKDDLLIDIGSNDGTLLVTLVSSNRVYGITPENIGYSTLSNVVSPLASRILTPR